MTLDEQIACEVIKYVKLCEQALALKRAEDKCKQDAHTLFLYIQELRQIGIPED